MTFTNSRKPNDDREVNLKMPFLTRVYIKKTSTPLQSALFTPN